MFFFFNVMFVDIYQYIFIWAGVYFIGGEPTPDEESLNIIVRIT